MLHGIGHVACLQWREAGTTDDANTDKNLIKWDLSLTHFFARDSCQRYSFNANGRAIFCPVKRSKSNNAAISTDVAGPSKELSRGDLKIERRESAAAAPQREVVAPL